MRIAFLAWRDTGHPDGGGSEVYVEQIAHRLAARGHQVTIVCSRYPGSRPDSVQDGVHHRRRGGRLTVYLHGLAWLCSPAGRRQDRVVEVINGLPFAARLVRRRGLVALVHHLHREQWHLIYPGLGGRVGWFVESRLTPALYRRVPHVTVSESSRRDLTGLGIEHTTVVRNGLELTTASAQRSATPRLVVLARLVPHKQIEHALDALAALRDDVPGLVLDVVGDGWWADRLREHATALGVTGSVVWHGRVDDDVRDRLLGEAWLALLPSTKEGWGLSIMEAAAMGTPSVAYRHAGGVTEAIVHGETGWLVDDRDELVDAVGRLLDDDVLRARISGAARVRASTFDWTSTAEAFETALQSP